MKDYEEKWEKAGVGGDWNDSGNRRRWVSLIPELILQGYAEAFSFLTSPA